MQAIIETSFDVVYLSSVIVLGVMLYVGSNGRRQYQLFGIMAVVLGLGDAFHLVPRAYALLATGLEANVYYLGIGKLITSITMTVFYVILYHGYRIRYKVSGKKGLTVSIYLLAALRIALSLLPQNEWTSLHPPLCFAIYRNIPFTIIGLITIVLYFKASRENDDKNFKNLWLSIVLSFGFYLPVVLFSNTYPIVGALMIPKTLAYVWTVVITYRAMKSEKIEGEVKVKEKNEVRSLVNIAMIYAFTALLSGVFYREFTKYYDYRSDTYLSLVHVHLMVLGFVAYMLFIAISLNTNLLSLKKFNIFRKIYNVGLVLMISSIFVKGVIQVLNISLNKALTASISGVSGVSHSMITVALVLLLLAMREMKVYRKSLDL